MIVRIFASGTSFKGLSAYLTHDPKAETAERVAWTHTYNLAHDHVPSAVDEMLWTARDAELLKQESGIRAGGRVTETPVKHVSLNWSPQDAPSREHMIETGESFLRRMGWQDYQAVFIAHSDKPHSHIHLLINACHPETGLKLDEGFEQRRAQAWALQYEREQGRIDCGQRLKDARDRQDAPTRDAWMAFQENQKEFERAEKFRRDEAEKSAAVEDAQDTRRQADWKILKDFQRDERLGFFADGKAKFGEIRAEVFQGVREDFRERWSALYAEQRNGADPATLKEANAALVAEQKTALAERRDQACWALRGSRDMAYRDLLDHQNDTRLIFRERVAAGLDNASFFQELRDGLTPPAEAAVCREAADQTTTRETSAYTTQAKGDREDLSRSIEPDADAHDGGGGIGLSLALGAFAIGESLFATFIATKPLPPTKEERKATADLFEAAAADTSRRQRQERDDADEEWRKRQRAYGD